MATFQDEEAASKVRARLESLTHSDLQEFFARSFERCPDPDQAARNLERWLRATSNPHEHLAHLLSTPQLTPLVMLLLGASQPLADAVIQNPELATLLTDPSVLQQVPNTEELLAEGRRLASSSTSYSHTLDRLRFLKQKTLLPLTVSDLAGIRADRHRPAEGPGSMQSPLINRNSGVVFFLNYFTPPFIRLSVGNFVPSENLHK